MENRKIKVKSLISVTAWAVALGMFIAYLFLERQWMLFTIDLPFCSAACLGSQIRRRTEGARMYIGSFSLPV